MSRETFEAHMEKRMKDLKQSGEHSIFHELQGRIIDYDYDKRVFPWYLKPRNFIKMALGSCLEVLWSVCLILLSEL